MLMKKILLMEFVCVCMISVRMSGELVTRFAICSPLIIIVLQERNSCTATCVRGLKMCGMSFFIFALSQL